MKKEEGRGATKSILKTEDVLGVVSIMAFGILRKTKRPKRIWIWRANNWMMILVDNPK